MTWRDRYITITDISFTIQSSKCKPKNPFFSQDVIYACHTNLTHSDANGFRLIEPIVRPRSCDQLVEQRRPTGRKRTIVRRSHQKSMSDLVKSLMTEVTAGRTDQRTSSYLLRGLATDSRLEATTRVRPTKRATCCLHSPRVTTRSVHDQLTLDYEVRMYSTNSKIDHTSYTSVFYINYNRETWF